jgi:hypothetical protein
MLEAYLDESGSHGSAPVLLVAGYVAEAESWRNFSTSWGASLAQYGVQHFHMKEIKNGRSRLFRHLSEEKRRELLELLVRHVKKHALMGSVVYMRPSEWVQATDQKLRNSYGSAYGMCINLILRQLDNTLINPLQFPEVVNVFIESGHKNEVDGLRQLKEWKELTDPPPEEIEGRPIMRAAPNPEREELLRVASYGSGTKDTVYPSHAADLLAHVAHGIIDAVHHGKENILLSGLGDALFSSVVHVSTYWDLANLRELVATLRQGDAEKLQIRARIHEKKKAIRALGLKVKQYAWGVTMDGRHLSEKEWRESISTGYRILGDKDE